MADACELLGMQIIDTVAQCNTAATALELSDTTATEGIDSPEYRPYGCCWNRGTLQLNLNSAARLRGTASDNTVQQVCIALPIDDAASSGSGLEGEDGLSMGVCTSIKHAFESKGCCNDNSLPQCGVLKGNFNYLGCCPDTHSRHNGVVNPPSRARAGEVSQFLLENPHPHVVWVDPPV